MVEFCISFLLIVFFVMPAQKIILWIADTIHEHFPQDIPFIPNWPLKTATSQRKLKRGHANGNETRLAVRGAIVVSGLISAVITGFALWLPILTWIIIISILVCFVDSSK